MAESHSEYQRIIQEMRAAVQAGDLDSFQTVLLSWFNLKELVHAPDSLADPILEVCAQPFVPAAFASLPPPIKLYALNAIFRHGIVRLADLTPQLEFLDQPAALANVSPQHRSPFIYLQVVGLLLQGRIQTAEAIHQQQQRKLTGYGLRGWLLFLAGDGAGAIRAFKNDLKILRRRENIPTAYFTGFEGLLFPIILLADHTHHHLPLLKEILAALDEHQPHNPLLPAYQVLDGVIAMLENRPEAARRILSLPLPPDNAVALIWHGLAHHWLGGGIPLRLAEPLRDLGKRARRHSHRWLAATIEDLQLGPTAARPQNGKARGSLATAIQSREPWQHALLAMDQEFPPPAPSADQPERRLAWHLDYREVELTCRLKPVIQHRRPGGQWSKGRPLALKRLLAAGELKDGRRSVLVDRRDRRLRAAITRESGPGGEVFQLTPDLTLLIGHPHLFLAGQPEIRVKLEEGHPVLLIEKGEQQTLRARLFPFPDLQRQLLLRQGPADFQVITCSRGLQALAGRLGPNGLHLPAEANAEDLFDRLGELPQELTVFSQLDQLPLAAAPATPDEQVVAQLMPTGSGLRLRLRVRPLGPDGPSLPPGHGPTAIWATCNGVRRRVTRDLAAEKAAADQLALLGGLSPESREPGRGTEEPASWLLTTPRHCLDFLARVRERSPTTPLEWPEGEGFSLSPTAGINRLHLRIGKKNNWFELEGSLRLDNGLILELGRLLRAASASPGRFIPLGHGRFLSLSAELRRKLEEIEAYAEIRRGEVRLHPLAARLLLGAGSSPDSDPAPQLETDQSWRDFLDGLNRTDPQPPPPPSTLNTELRPYQLDGYHWLLRMAELGFGACLADDMGLGKTIQGLALLLHRASLGPSLVIAPTSVCRNWQEEAARFAPTLRVISYDGPDRHRLPRDFQPFDLVICSYGLLQRDAEVITGPHWSTIVLDEAQAIKNFLAKRSRAAMKLNGDFKLITTGTPLENHLAELWTLFLFINPGLLGSLDHFNRRFIVPIEQHNDTAARTRLKKLLTPFVMRRLKGEVLKELPPRTDVTLRVEMHREEGALYEALRRQALVNLEAGHERHDSPLRILAEIMKLRRACCHPRLVLADSRLPCAKLDLFAKVVTELLENRHKILVFSQFVDHLAIVRELLDRRKVSYQYLDGATPPATRQRRVRAFQQGQGDLFLISLRAGGLGLNLTAADYVIHLDPWWNPAVEEQASDRAHRIGQKKPVTVYRLITTGTIEEKILALHRHKRRLSTELLDGNRLGPPQSSAELLALLQDR